MIGEKQLGVFTATDAKTGELTTFSAEAVSYVAGDSEFLDQGRLQDLQIRPMLKSERTPNSVDRYPPGAHWLVWQSRTGGQLRALVNLPFARRKNIRSNVLYALGLVEKFDPAHGALFRLVDAGVDPFDLPAKG